MVLGHPVSLGDSVGVVVVVETCKARRAKNPRGDSSNDHAVVVVGKEGNKGKRKLVG